MKSWILCCNKVEVPFSLTTLTIAAQIFLSVPLSNSFTTKPFGEVISHHNIANKYGDLETFLQFKLWRSFKVSK